MPPNVAIQFAAFRIKSRGPAILAQSLSLGPVADLLVASFRCPSLFLRMMAMLLLATQDELQAIDSVAATCAWAGVSDIVWNVGVLAAMPPHAIAAKAPGATKIAMAADPAHETPTAEVRTSLSTGSCSCETASWSSKAEGEPT